MHPIFKVSSRLSPFFRRKRMRRFLEWFRPGKETRILDIGGLPRFWADVSIPAHITLLNLYPLDTYDRSFLAPGWEAVVGDGTQLDYADNEFDIVFSNSVIEHLGTLEKQTAFAREAQRVGKSYWVQTPAKEFFLEPHFITPVIHWFPKHVQKRLLRNFTLWGWLERPDEANIDSVLAELRLLNAKEFNRLFADSRVYTERVLGWPKSYTAYKLPEAATGPAPATYWKGVPDHSPGKHATISTIPTPLGYAPRERHSAHRGR